jgi:hypothetical protein
VADLAREARSTPFANKVAPFALESRIGNRWVNPLTNRKMNLFGSNGTSMINRNHSQNLAVRRHTGCFHDPFLLPVLVAVVTVLVACPSQAQFTYTTNNGTITITGYGGTNDVVVIPSTIDGLPVTTIGTTAFLYALINTVSIPNSVTNIEDYAFSQWGYASLTAIAVDSANQNYSSIGGALFDKSQKTIIQYPEAKSGTSYTLPDTVTSIGNHAFFGCVSLTNVTIPNSVTSIGDSAFDSCTRLTSITIPDSVTNIGGAAFCTCRGLTNVTIPNSVTSIGDSAFDRCTTLTSVTIPSSVTSIGGGAFGECTSLAAINVETNNPAYTSVDGVLFNQSLTTLIQYPGGKVGSYSIPNNVTSIGGGGFWDCGLISVTIPNSVTSIGHSAFGDCASLANITIGNGVTSIGDGAFVQCYSLTNVTIPNGVTSIGAEAFFDCYGLTSVTVPNSVTSIEEGAFAHTSLTSVMIPNSVTNIGDGAFDYCESLTSVYFQGSAPSLGAFVFGMFPWSIVWPLDNATAYYLPGTTGWSTNYGGIPTGLWTLPYPLLLNNSPGFGVQANGFGFTVSWATNLNVVVEAAIDLDHPVWSSVATNTLNDGTVYFSDPQWTKYPSRFYRVRSQ